MRILSENYSYIDAIQILSTGYLPINFVPPSQLKAMITQVIKRLHLYYDMKLVTFGIEDNSNLNVQFPVIVQPYSQLPLTLYQREIFPVSNRLKYTF